MRNLTLSAYFAAVFAAAIAAFWWFTHDTQPPPRNVSQIAATSTPARVTPEAWCAVKLGDSRTSVTKKLGKGEPYEIAEVTSTKDTMSLSAMFWVEGERIYLATFENKRAVNLQAYQGEIGPNPAQGLPCKAFRHP